MVVFVSAPSVKRQKFSSHAMTKMRSMPMLTASMYVSRGILPMHGIAMGMNSSTPTISTISSSEGALPRQYITSVSAPSVILLSR